VFSAVSVRANNSPSGITEIREVKKSGWPVATEVPHELKKFGEVRQDPYFWLRGKEKPEVIKYLEAENTYFAQTMQPHRKLKDSLLAELKGHIQEEETTYPTLKDGYFYFAKMLRGKEYSQLFRKAAGKKGREAREQMILDVNTLNPKGSYTRIAANVVSDDGRMMAYALDIKGDRLFRVYFKDLKTGKALSDVIENCTGDIAWAADNKSIFYGAYEPVTLRQRYVHRHVLGEQKDSLVYDEKDEKFNVDVKRSLSKRFIFLEARSKVSSEIHYLSAETPTSSPRLFQARQPEFEYSVADGGDRFYIRTNWNAVNFRVMETKPENTARDSWQEVIVHRPDTFIEEMTVLKDHLVLEEKRDGLNQIEVLERASKKGQFIAFKDPAYSAWLEGNAEYVAHKINFVYTSLTTPRSVIEFDLVTKTQSEKWQRKIPGGFRPENYASQRFFATAADGERIPISIVYRVDRRGKGRPQPLLQYGYGSYGNSMDPWFSSDRLPLLDRGFIFAIAHVRGGSEMGREWYLNGKFLKKRNTFNDFIAASEFLIKEGLTSVQQLFAKGVSAGGLLVGAVMNMRPDLYRGVIAGVPFVDVLTTMLDASLPLTTEEYEEWGNPNDKTYYEYMKSYSPYDNVRAQGYPNLLVTAGLNDTQVSYWEPAKWVARLRKFKTDNNLLIFKIEMGAGHSGKNGRFTALELEAAEQAFLLTLAGTEK
jgi:oligopeptidase B